MNDASSKPVILLSANSAWNVVNFRAGLIRGLKQAGYDVAVAAPADGHQDRLNLEEVRYFPLPMNRSGMNPFADFVLFARYARLMREVRPSVYLGFTIKPNIYGSLAARLLGIPVINNVSGLGTMFLGQSWRSRLAKALYRMAFDRSATVFFQNPEDEKTFLDAGTVRKDQSQLLPGSGIDLDHYKPMPLPEGPPLFLFIGRLIRDKGVREFVDAARLVRGRIPDARFQMLGDRDPGNRTSVSAVEIEGWRSEGIVELSGEVEDVRPSIARARAVVLPSYREGLPRVLLEASAMGRPLIATDVPGCRTIVSDGDNGLLCAVRDAQALADMMIKLALLAPDQLRAMGQTARKTVERDYDQRRVVAAYLAALADIMPDSRVRAG